MPKDYEREAEKDENLLVEDIAMRIVESANSSKGLYGSLTSSRRNTEKQLEEFLEDFWSLYDTTVDQIDDSVIKHEEDLDKEELKENEEEPPLTVEELQEFFMNPYIIARQKNEEGEIVAVRDDKGMPVKDPAKSAQRAISIYREYKKWLRESGILDLARYSPKKRSFDAREEE